MPQVEVSVQMPVELSKERNSQPVVEFWQLALHSQMSSTMNTSTTVPWHWPGSEQSEQAEQGQRFRHNMTLQGGPYGRIVVWVDLDLGYPWLVGRSCSYLLPEWCNIQNQPNYPSR